MYEKLFELLALAKDVEGASVHLSIHNVPLVTAAQWVQDGLLDNIGPGAGGNPPTGELNKQVGSKVEATVFTDGPRRRSS